MKQQETTPKTREQLFAEKAGKSYAVCYSQTCTLRQHCLRWQLSSYLPESRRLATSTNLNNPAMQTETCRHAPAHCSSAEAASHRPFQP